ncbi:MAG: hypothetical protein IJ348_05900 [Alistipes sp.]|nr:hypothetical protein [Alistipes sp.]
MKLRSYIASVLLTVYLVSVCGYALTVILCHCERSGHYTTHHKECCACHHHAHHEACEGIHADNTCNCLHKHTTEIELYDVAKEANPTLAPLSCDILLPDLESAEESRAECFGEQFLQRKIPLPQSIVGHVAALRAPPVSA